MCQLLLWLSSPMPRWEIRWIWSIKQFICFHFYSGHSSLRISEASRPKIGVAMSGLFLNISLQGVKVSGARYQIPGTCLFVLRHDLKSSFHLGKMKLSLFNDWPKCLITSKKFVLIVQIKLKRKSLLPVSKLLLVKMRVTLRQVIAK